MQGGPSTRIEADFLAMAPRLIARVLCEHRRSHETAPMKKNPDKTLETPHDDAERQVALRKIRRLMEFWRIEPHELRGRPSRPAPVAEAVLEVRYRHPVSGETWDGRGAQPQWLREALIREGYTVDELRRAVCGDPPG